MAILGMFTAVAGMMDGGRSSWDDKITEHERKKLAEKQQRAYKTLLESRGVKEFYSRELDVTVMARDWNNAQRKFNNIRKALQQEGLML
jgi:hypothetical protein